MNEKLIELAKAYKKAHNTETSAKAEKEKIGKEIKALLGDNFDDFIIVKNENEQFKITYKIKISFVADREKIEKDGLFDEYYKPSQSHPLTVN